MEIVAWSSQVNKYSFIFTILVRFTIYGDVWCMIKVSRTPLNSAKHLR